MQTKQFISILLVLTSVLSFSQKKIKYKTVYFEDNTVETPNAKVSLSDVIAEDNLITENNISNETLALDFEIINKKLILITDNDMN